MTIFVFKIAEINAVLDMVNLKIQWKRGNKKLLRLCQKKCIITGL